MLALALLVLLNNHIDLVVAADLGLAVLVLLRVAHVLPDLVAVDAGDDPALLLVLSRHLLDLGVLPLQSAARGGPSLVLRLLAALVFGRALGRVRRVPVELVVEIDAGLVHRMRDLPRVVHRGRDARVDGADRRGRMFIFRYFG